MREYSLVLVSPRARDRLRQDTLTLAFPPKCISGASRTVRCMQDCPTPIFRRADRTRAFSGVRPTRGDPVHPITIFMPRGAPFAGHGIFSEMILREML